MPPKRGESVELTTEYEDFMEKLSDYHDKRGTVLEREPKVGVRRVDLSKLYKRVVEEGGYDLCSDTKAKPLMWRRFAEEFVGKNPYTAAQAFQIKNVYYKNLCAYEISTHWEKEPPPKEILEEVTAKGGNVMGRTLENYVKPPTKEEMNLGGEKEGSDASPEQKTTPKVEKSDEVDDPGSAAGRTTRGLRQQPPQRQLFAPGTARETRGTAAASPTPGGTSNTNGSGTYTSLPNGSSSAAASSTLASYEPSQSYPLSLKPVITPANNPDHYRQQLKRKAETAMGPLAKKYKNIMLPGTGFIGPNIYVRAQLALQSGIEEEEQYALHHLVKISHERGDKYRFDQFPGLAEALIKKCLCVSTLFYDVDWDLSYDYSTMDADDETLDGLRGTPDVVRKLRNMIPHVTDDGMADPAFTSQLNRVLEAGLILRNMALQPENAKYLVSIPTTRDYLAIVLNLPQHPGIIELQHYALETAEQILVWCDLGPRDALYQALITQLYSEDRGAITIALRTIARIAMNLPGPKRLDDVPAEVLRKIQRWLLLEDEELRGAGLDFLFQFTSSADNVAILLRTLEEPEALTRQLSRLLLSGAKEVPRKDGQPSRKDEEEDDRTLHPIPRLSKSVIHLLLQIEEPERSSEWLRMLFAPSPVSEMTQISLWQAYQATFAPFNNERRAHLVAGEFIKNVSLTFGGATAQVSGGGKYVIRGIRARGMVIEGGLLKNGKKGAKLGKCRWMVGGMVRPGEMMAERETECGEWFRRDGSLEEHIMSEHLGLPRLPVARVKAEDVVDSMEIDSTLPTSRPSSAMALGSAHASRVGTPVATKPTGFDYAAADQTLYRCRWAGSCHRTTLDFDNDGLVSRTALFARHVRTHLPDPETEESKHNLTAEEAKKVVRGDKIVLQSLVDEKNDAAGVALSAALVMRNLAKFMPVSLSTTPAMPVEAGHGDLATKVPLNDVKAAKDVDGGLMAKVFDEEVIERLMWAMTHCKPMHSYVGNVLRAITRGGEGG
ncbi:Chromatin structure-remodeling complex protein rsc9 [Elasticomyces elasticus]|nr:Chromatin structure-remodeling complex protein rsc9 [Elasticomyces elasticus]KAK3631796.1 Chromatin structure-remodeling complex protein rsc9 [Elasticomyces elasticus]KAK4909609.1 Chromatin structure-remodeling complex protein rsc9 [Elasticomyces elasticus]KAK5749514.1 Chromatin structure-remodeling complex protein rsc9 [Elasticomyces elasticus]